MTAAAAILGWAGTARAQAQAPERRLALVIGVSEYASAPLPSSVNDGATIAATLRKLNFEVEPLSNPTAAEIRAAVGRLEAAARAAPRNTTLAVFFSGHAVQVGGENFLIPKGASLGREIRKADFERDSVSAQSILTKLSGTGVPRLMLLLDACRTNPLPADAGGQSTGLARMGEVPGGPDTLILFATQPGRSAYGGTSGTSFFTRALADTLAVPDYSVPEIVAAVSDRVASDTGGAQKPYFEGSLTYTFNRTRARSPASALLADQARFNGPEDGASLLKEALKSRTLAQIEAEAASGNGFAHFLAGMAYWDGIGGAEANAKRAIGHMRQATARGIGRAANALGYFYCCTDELGRNQIEGTEWFKVGADLGSTTAKRNLGMNLLDGVGADPNVELGIKYLQEAAEGGSARAWFNLGSVYFARKYDRVDLPRAMDYFQRAFDGGYAYAAMPLGKAWENGIGSGGTQVDLARASAIFIQGGEAGCVECWSSAANIYSRQDYSGYDIEAAVMLYKRGADAGDMDSMLEYARYLSKGFMTTPPNPRAAYEIYVKAEKAGSLEARGRIARAIANGEGVQRDPARAARMLRELLARDLDPDLKKRHALSDLGYWDLATALMKLIGDKLVPEASAGEAKRLKARYGRGTEQLRRFTVPIDCGGSAKVPFHIYVTDWDRPDDETIEGQASWIKETKGCEVPQDVLDTFKKLKKIARENRLSFMHLVVHALDQVNAVGKTEISGLQAQPDQARAIYLAMQKSGFRRNPRMSLDPLGIALRGFDPMSYGQTSAPVRGDAGIFALWNGAIWFFANDGNRATFLKNPTRHVPQYGGFSATHVADGHVQASDPGNFLIRSGRLYLFAAKDGPAAWAGDADRLARVADAAWPKLPGFKADESTKLGTMVTAMFPILPQATEFGQVLVDEMTREIQKLGRGRADKAKLAGMFGSRSWGYVLLNKPDEVIADVDRGLALDPTAAWMGVNRGHALILKGQLAEGIAILREMAGKPDEADGDTICEGVVDDLRTLETSRLFTADTATRIREAVPCDFGTGDIKAKSQASGTSEPRP